MTSQDVLFLPKVMSAARSFNKMLHPEVDVLLSYAVPIIAKPYGGSVPDRYF